MRNVLLAGFPPAKVKRIRNALQLKGYEACVASTSGQVWEALMRNPPDALVLQVRAGGADLDPWRLMQDLQALDHLPVIALTRAGRNQDRLRSFQSGALQCLTMPASASEVSASLDALFSRKGLHAAQGRSAIRSRYADPLLQIDLTNREVRRRGRVLTLTSRECPLLQRLIQNAGQTISSRELCELVWGRRSWRSKRALLKTYILQLRHKIEVDTGKHRYIISRRGQGYAFMPRPAGG